MLMTVSEGTRGTVQFNWIERTVVGAFAVAMVGVLVTVLLDSRADAQWREATDKRLDSHEVRLSDEIGYTEAEAAHDFSRVEGYINDNREDIKAIEAKLNTIAAQNANVQAKLDLIYAALRGDG